MAKWPGFVGPSYALQSKIAADDRCVNWIPSKVESGTGEADYVFDPAPGFVSFCETGTNVGRGAFTLNGVTWAIFGSNIYQLPDAAGGTPILLAQGLNNPDNAPAQMVGNGDAGGQLLIMSGSTKYYLTIGVAPSVTTLLTPPPAPSPIIPVIAAGVSALPTGYFGYAVTFVTGTGETTPSDRVIANNAGTGGFNALYLNGGIALGPASSGVTARNLYRTPAQVSSAAAITAPLQLLSSITLPVVYQFADTFDDASLGANPPTSNTATVTLTALTALPNPATQIAFMDGYGLALDANRSEVRFSALEDFSSWDGLDVFQRNDAADKWLAMIVAHKEIWLFGSKTTSVYYNSGDAANPFIPNPSASITRGTIAPNSVGLLNGSPIWLADDLTVRYAQGYVPQRISTFAVEYAISQMSAVFDAECKIYTEQGHQIYILDFPAANASWAYDLTTGLWHERGVADGMDFDVMNVRCCAATSTANLVLSRTGSQAYAMTQDSELETSGGGMERMRRAPHVSKDNNGIVIDSVEVHLETGIGLATGQGSNPQISLRFSRDGGQTWSNTRTVSAGKIGQYKTRAIWRNLGWGRDHVIEVRCSDPIPWRVMDAFMSLREGAS